MYEILCIHGKEQDATDFAVSYVNFPSGQAVGLSNFPLAVETELKELQKPIVNSVGDAVPCSSLK